MIYYIAAMLMLISYSFIGYVNKWMAMSFFLMYFMYDDSSVTLALPHVKTVSFVIQVLVMEKLENRRVRLKKD